VRADGSGVGFDSSTGFVLPNGATRSPDVARIRRSRWESVAREQRERFVPLCPDFVVEPRSPFDVLDDLRARVQEYMDNGCQLGWLIDPVERTVCIYRPRTPVECLGDPPVVSGEPVLPGFALDLRAIWNEPPLGDREPGHSRSEPGAPGAARSPDRPRAAAAP
jgi:Uma2 family endonuclease